MSTEEVIGALKTVATILIGGVFGKYGDKLIEWMRHGRKDRAEVKKTEAEVDEIDTKIALTVAKELREDLKEMREENKRLRIEQKEEASKCKKEMSEMWEKVETLSTALYEEKKRNNGLERKIQEMEYEMKKYKPDERRPQGGRF